MAKGPTGTEGLVPVSMAHAFGTHWRCGGPCAYVYQDHSLVTWLQGRAHSELEVLLRQLSKSQPRILVHANAHAVPSGRMYGRVHTSCAGLLTVFSSS